MPPLRQRLSPWRLAAAAAVLLCDAASGQGLEIVVQPVFGDDPVVADSLRFQLDSGETVSVTRLSVLWSGFALQKEDGTWIELSGRHAWTDLAARRQRISLAEIPAGNYQALRFSIGPDAAANDSKPDRWPPDHPLNPNVNGLHWSWQGGYIFAAIKGLCRRDAAPPFGYSYHFARDANRTGVTLPAALSLPAGTTVAATLAFDVKRWLRGISPGRDGTSSHSREGDPLAAALRENLPPAFRIGEIAVAAAPPPVPPPVAPLFLPKKYTPYRFSVGAGFPFPALPRDNPLLEERVALGRRLFAEPLLSRDGTVSCLSCHDPAHSFSDPRRVSLGADGRAGTRNAMALVNLAWKQVFFWDGRAASLRQQALMPIQDHAEMDESLDRVVAKLQANPDYPALFAAAFEPAAITAEKIGLALENFLLTLTSHDAKIDRVMRGDAAWTEEERRGFELFFTEYEPRSGRMGADCFHCHGGATFSDHQFHNNGLPSAADTGLFALTKNAADRGKFIAPTLRNVARTAPYMHDGRFQTLEEVVAHYASGVQRTPNLDPNLAKHPGGGIPLSPADQQALVAFLHSLSELPPQP